MTDDEKPMVFFEEGAMRCIFCEEKITAEAVDEKGNGVTVFHCEHCGEQHAFHDLCGTFAALITKVAEDVSREYAEHLKRVKALMN